jgi:hypothetical protein
MFCSQCGVKASGKFCYQCGNPLQTSDTDLLPSVASIASEPEDWEQDAVYEKIIRVEAVRTAISHHAANAHGGVSGEALLALYDKVMSSPVPLEHLVAIVQPLYDSWGIRTGKERHEWIDAPIGRVIARTLCSFAKHAQAFQRAEQFESGCVLTAELPSSVCSLKGKLTISLKRSEDLTEVTATTIIPGQIYDWGKSDRCLEQLINDLSSELGLPPSTIQRKVA